MFMTPDELVDKVNKGDTAYQRVAPRQQWEGPGSADLYGHRWSEKSLQEKKTFDLQPGGTHHEAFAGKPWGTVPPVTIQHGRPGKAPMLTEGHHRLAWAQMHGTPFINVEHHFPSASWVEMDAILSDERKQKQQ